MRSDAGFHVPKDIEHSFGRGDRFANVDRLDNLVSQLRSGLHAALFILALEDREEFGIFAVNLFLRWRLRQCISDHRAHIFKCGFPILAQGRKADKGRIGRARDIILLNLSIEIAAPAPCARLQPAVDHRLAHRIDQQAFIIDNRVVHRTPRTHHGISDRARHIRFCYDRQLANRIGRISAFGRNRIAEIRRLLWLANALPIAEPLFDQASKLVRVGVPCD